jgi:hypothetical protein
MFVIHKQLARLISGGEGSNCTLPRVSRSRSADDGRRMLDSVAIACWTVRKEVTGDGS